MIAETLFRDKDGQSVGFRWVKTLWLLRLFMCGSGENVKGVVFGSIFACMRFLIRCSTYFAYVCFVAVIANCGDLELYFLLVEQKEKPIKMNLIGSC